MSWNLGLAVVPLIFVDIALRARTPPLRFGALTVWLLFFPNAPYLITDLVHLNKGGAPVWYDLGLLSAFAVAGLLLAVASLLPVHCAVERRFGAGPGWLTVVAVCGLSGFGIYLGRFLRFNSWDVATRPGEVLFALLPRVLDPLAYPRTWGVTVLFGALLFAVYVGLWGDARTAAGLVRKPRTKDDDDGTGLYVREVSWTDGARLSDRASHSPGVGPPSEQ